MKRDDWMLLTLTFLTGLAIGLYVYIAFFKPTYVPENLNQSESAASDWSIVAIRRGGTEPRYVQPAFRVLEDGSYQYRAGGMPDTDVSQINEGNLPKSLIRDLNLSTEMLRTYSEQSLVENCLSNQGGYDFEYRISLEGETYVLDTCLTNFSPNSELYESLEAIWDSLEGETTNSNRTGGWLENWVRDNFGVN